MASLTEELIEPGSSGNHLSVKYTIKDIKDNLQTIPLLGKEYLLCGLIVCQARVELIKRQNSKRYPLFFLRLYKLRHARGSTQAVVLNCTTSKNKTFLLNADDDCYFLSDPEIQSPIPQQEPVFNVQPAFGIATTQNQHVTYGFTLSMRLELFVDPSSKLTASGFDDVSTDFEMRGKDGGCVRIHKSMMVFLSEVLRNMLSGEWRETSEQRIDMPATKQTLEHLKAYMYKCEVPETEADLTKLVQLASYLMTRDLEFRCSMKLLGLVNKNNFYNLMQLAIGLTIKTLFLGILAMIERGVIKTADIDVSMFDAKEEGKGKKDDEASA